MQHQDQFVKQAEPPTEIRQCAHDSIHFERPTREHLQLQEKGPEQGIAAAMNHGPPNCDLDFVMLNIPAREVRSLEHLREMKAEWEREEIA
jgi:hypothetical protein